MYAVYYYPLKINSLTADSLGSVKLQHWDSTMLFRYEPYFRYNERFKATESIEIILSAAQGPHRKTSGNEVLSCKLHVRLQNDVLENRTGGHKLSENEICE